MKQTIQRNVRVLDYVHMIQNEDQGFIDFVMKKTKNDVNCI